MADCIITRIKGHSEDEFIFTFEFPGHSRFSLGLSLQEIHFLNQGKPGYYGYTDLGNPIEFSFTDDLVILSYGIWEYYADRERFDKDMEIEMNKIRSLFESKAGRLYDLLACKDYYSLEINYTSKKTDLSLQELRDFANRSVNSGQYFYYTFNDPLNIFTFKDITYIGLQSRKVAYDEDAKLGINRFEK